mmetsp:Transcript_127995/g.272947  ORF Transcript_127995/g.272947 Transcript_127995/m.272947 type:complete len:211 (-) Transcript_127995:356-988(-)
MLYTTADHLRLEQGDVPVVVVARGLCRSWHEHAPRILGHTQMGGRLVHDGNPPRRVCGDCIAVWRDVLPIPRRTLPACEGRCPRRRDRIGAVVVELRMYPVDLRENALVCVQGALGSLRSGSDCVVLGHQVLDGGRECVGFRDRCPLQVYIEAIQIILLDEAYDFIANLLLRQPLGPDAILPAHGEQCQALAAVGVRPLLPRCNISLHLI